MESSLETEAGGEGRCWVQLVVEEGEAGVTASASTGCWSQVFCSCRDTQPSFESGHLGVHST